MSTLSVEILTPDGIFLKDDAEFVVLPGQAGELGVLPGHMRLVAQLVPANVRLVKGSQTRRIATAAGMAYIGPTSIKVFTTTARPVAE